MAAKSSILNTVSLLNLQCTPHILEFYTLQQYYETKYGHKTVVLLQKGTFYETYQFNPTDDGTNVLGEIGNVNIKLNIRDDKYKTLTNQDYNLNTSKNIGRAVKVGNLLRIKITSIDSNKPHSLNNPYMAGVPKIMYLNHRDILLLNGYTVIRVDEINKNSDNTANRAVGEISSPGTEIETLTSYNPTNSNGLACLFIQYVAGKKNFDRTLIVSGLSYIDLSTGYNSAHELYSKENDENYAIQEIYRFLSMCRPAEIIIYLHAFPTKLIEDYSKFLVSTLELHNYTTHHIYYQVAEQFFNLEYQEAFLTKLYPQLADNALQNSNRLINIIDRLDLASLTYGRVAYIAILFYTYEHNPNLLNSLPLPVTNNLDEKNNLVLTNNSIFQLHLMTNHLSISEILNDEDLDSLIKILDHCQTSMGSRFLKSRLLNPITSVNRLNLSYEITNELIANQLVLTDLYKILAKIKDVERLERMATLDMLKPTDFATLLESYKLVQLLYNYVVSQENLVVLKKILPDKLVFQQFEAYLQWIEKNINLAALKQTKYKPASSRQNASLTCKESFINLGCYPEIDNLINSWKSYYTYLEMVTAHLCEVSPKGGKGNPVNLVIEKKKEQLTEEEEEGPNNKISIVATVSKSNHILRSAQLNRQLVGQDIQAVKVNAKNMMFVSTYINQYSQGLEVLHQQLEQQLVVIYLQILANLKKQTFFSALNRFVCNIDFLYNNAKIALKNNYYCPKIVDLKNGVSYLQVQNLRHPLIEKLIKNEYIGNDIELGQMLLYGVNSSGKTSLARSLGIAICMAQAGFFTAGNLVYYPFTRIITRLTGNDDLLKGKSSFIVEMSELAIILKNADQNSLVLGDEITKGTESASGTGIIIATIEELVKRKSSFIFSTHLHHLIDLNDIKVLPIQIKHLSTVYDNDLDTLIYDRKLKEGSGSSLYGLEVCKSMNIDSSFISRAMDLRSKYLGLDEGLKLSLDLKKSHFNSEIIVDKCVLCGAKVELETHHIKEQKNADANNMIGYYHKNSAFNLVVMCRTCHHNLHQSNQRIQKIETLNGVHVKVI